MQKNELAEIIKLSIEDSSIPLWFPNLTPHLAEIGWQSLKNEFGLNPSNYATSRVLTGKVNSSLSVFPCPTKFTNIPFHIELLPKELTAKYADSQIEFYNAEELTKLPVLDCIAEAIGLIKLVPSLCESIFTLVKSVHLIKLEDNNYDVSFSEPNIPFSIFISVPKNRIKADYLRVAEAIVHEAMHLQFTLIEKIAFLIKSNEQKFYSPWKDEYRNVGGILHALYVFRVIDSFYTQIVQFLPTKKHNDYIINRQNLISQQTASVNKIDLFQELTEYGNALVNRLVTDQI